MEIIHGKEENWKILKHFCRRCQLSMHVAKETEIWEEDSLLFFSSWKNRAFQTFNFNTPHFYLSFLHEQNSIHKDFFFSFFCFYLKNKKGLDGCFWQAYWFVLYQGCKSNFYTVYCERKFSCCYHVTSVFRQTQKSLTDSETKHRKNVSFFSVCL